MAAGETLASRTVKTYPVHFWKCPACGHENRVGPVIMGGWSEIELCGGETCDQQWLVTR